MNDIISALFAFLSYGLLVSSCLCAGYHVYDSYPWLAVVVGMICLYLTAVFVLSVVRCRRSGRTLARVLLSGGASNIALTIVLPVCTVFFADDGCDDMFITLMFWLIVDTSRKSLSKYIEN